MPNDVINTVTIHGTTYDIGGSGGHTIKNPAGTAMTQRSNLQFVDLTVSDDSINDTTKVENIHVIQSESELENLPDGLYMLNDDEDTVIDGNLVGYDNTNSELDAENVQDAIDEVVETLDDKIDISAKGIANGIAELDSTGKVPSSQLPSFVDDVIEVADHDHLPATGETGKIYVTLDTNKTYRWGGTEYVEISESLALGETSSTAYRGDRGKTAYDHSQLTSGNPHNVTKSDIGLDNVDNTSDSTKKTNFTGSIASGNTGFVTGGDAYTALSGKADKVSGATNGNLAGLNGSGNLTDSGWNGAKDTTSISGNPISISGLKSNQLAVSPIITFEPIQAGSGTPSPSNIRAISGYDKVEALSCGKNLFDISKVIINVVSSVSGTTITKAASGYNYDIYSGKSGQSQSSEKRLFLKAGTYVISFTSTANDKRIYVDGINPDTLVPNGTINKTVSSGSTFTVSSASWVCLKMLSSEAATWSNIQIEEATTPTAYSPYVKATSISESLGQTVYGATWTIRDGKLIITHAKKRMDGNDTFAGSNPGVNAQLQINGMKSGRWVNDSKAVCDSLEKTSGIVTGKSTILIGGDNNVVYIYNMNLVDASINSSATLNAYLANHPIEFTYPLDNPIEIQLTPREIILLEQYAYLSTNGTLIQLSYHNGELASLADVSQLGETVNELGEYVGRNEYFTTIALDDRVGSSNKYEFPYDGYIYISSETVTTGSIRVIITAYNSTQNIAYLYMNITSAYERQSLFVKKGMCLYLQAAIPSGTRVRYIPFM